MNHTITIYQDDAPIYDIYIREDLHDLANALYGLKIENRKLFIVTESTVASYYLEALKEALRPLGRFVHAYVFPAGEQNKNLDIVRGIYTFLIEQKADRNDVIFALGGGVTGDLAGYTAATYLRGIRFVQMPTSLLAMVDSSIGGKTGVDFDSYKNMVGAFHQPSAVYMNLSSLLTLNERQYLSGFAEVIKHGLLCDAPLYAWMKENREALLARDLPVLQEMITRSCLDKKAIVEKDPKEKGDRALLNLGHTIGHAVEKCKDFTLLHGECVAIGTVAAAYLSWKREMITKEEYLEIKDTFANYHLPVNVSGLSSQEILSASKSDKKMDGGHVKFILLEEIGHAVIRRDVEDAELLSAIDSILVE
ncbi:MAG: 3-dehydroquinate synthase [Lachnospiraceae bacterium]|nr:3-dehydroquinate synthase [Lachnospiraceae bacterium]